MPEGEPEKENPLGDVNAARTLASGVHFSCCGKGGVRGHLRARQCGGGGWGEKGKKKTLPVDPLHLTWSSVGHALAFGPSAFNSINARGN